MSLNIDAAIDRTLAQIDQAAVTQLAVDLVSIPSPTGSERAVASFLAGKLRFPDIAATVEEALHSADFNVPQSINEVLEIDRATRSRARAMMKDVCH